MEADDLRGLLPFPLAPKVPRAWARTVTKPPKPAKQTNEAVWRVGSKEVGFTGKWLEPDNVGFSVAKPGGVCCTLSKWLLFLRA